MPGSQSVRVGEVIFDPATGELTRADGTTQRLRPQASKALDALVQARGLVTRQALHDAIWPDTHVEFDLNLNVCIRQLRVALNDDAEEPRYIETLPRRGYRLVAPVTRIEKDGSTGVGVMMRWAGVIFAALVFVMVVSRAFVPPTPTRISMAVMPFRAIPSTDSLTYLEAGLSEELITALASVNPDELAVIARTSSFNLADRGLEAAGLGAELGVDYVLAGAVRTLPDGYRVTARLLDMSDQTFVWSDSYDLTHREVLYLERYVAREVTSALASRLTAMPGAQFVSEGPRPLARDAVLRARFLLSRFTRDDASRALEHLAAARMIDSTHATVFVEVARAHLQLGNLEEAEGALAIARTLSSDHATIDAVAGQTALYGRADVQAAVGFLARAVAAQPGAADVRRVYANALVAAGRAREAVVHARRALELDPVSSVVRGDVGQVFYYAEEYDEARRICHSTLELIPTSQSAQACIILSAALTNRLADELPLVAAVASGLGATEQEAADLTDAIRARSNHVLWEWFLTDSRRTQLGLTNVARLEAMLGRNEEAAAAAQAARQGGGPTALFLPVDPVLQQALGEAEQGRS